MNSIATTLRTESRNWEEIRGFEKVNKSIHYQSLPGTTKHMMVMYSQLTASSMPKAYTTRRPKVTWNCISDPRAPLYLVSAVSDTYVGAKRVKAPPEKPAKFC